MALSINPLAQLITQSSESIAQATNEANAALPQVGDIVSKANLDSTISRLSGGLNSGLNGLTGTIPSLGGLNINGASSLVANAGTALGGIGNVASSTVSSAINSLQSTIGSTSNITSDITGSLSKLTGGDLANGLTAGAGALAKAAGMLNNILSLKRGANIPSGAELFQQRGQAITLEPSAKSDWRVRLNANWELFNSPLFKLLERTGGVVWPYLPNISVSTKANYTQIDTVHSNYPFQAYKNSQVDEISISGEFTCETETDAAYWIAATTFFKTATKMFFGQGANAGNPPIICHLYGYGSSVFDKVPVVVKSFSVDLKDDINYVKCNTFGTSTWVPVMSTISITVQPIYNRTNLRKFNLQDYAKGKTLTGSGVGFL